MAYSAHCTAFLCHNVLSYAKLFRAYPEFEIDSSLRPHTHIAGQLWWNESECFSLVLFGHVYEYFAGLAVIWGVQLRRMRNSSGRCAQKHGPLYNHWKWTPDHNLCGCVGVCVLLRRMSPPLVSAHAVKIVLFSEPSNLWRPTSLNRDLHVCNFKPQSVTRQNERERGPSVWA